MCVVQHFGQLHVQAGFTAMRSSCGLSLGLACPGETDACALSYAGGPSQLWSASVMSSRGGGIWGRCSLQGRAFTPDVVGRAGWEGEGIV